MVGTRFLPRTMSVGELEFSVVTTGDGHIKEWTTPDRQPKGDKNSNETFIKVGLSDVGARQSEHC